MLEVIAFLGSMLASVSSYPRSKSRGLNSLGLGLRVLDKVVKGLGFSA